MDFSITDIKNINYACSKTNLYKFKFVDNISNGKISNKKVFINYFSLNFIFPKNNIIEYSKIFRFKYNLKYILLDKFDNEQFVYCSKCRKTKNIKKCNFKDCKLYLCINCV